MKLRINYYNSDSNYVFLERMMCKAYNAPEYTIYYPEISGDKAGTFVDFDTTQDGCHVTLTFKADGTRYKLINEIVDTNYNEDLLPWPGNDSKIEYSFSSGFVYGPVQNISWTLNTSRTEGILEFDAYSAEECGYHKDWTKYYDDIIRVRISNEIIMSAKDITVAHNPTFPGPIDPRAALSLAEMHDPLRGFTNWPRWQITTCTDTGRVYLFNKNTYNPNREEGIVAEYFKPLEDIFKQYSPELNPVRSLSRFDIDNIITAGPDGYNWHTYPDEAVIICSDDHSLYIFDKNYITETTKYFRPISDYIDTDSIIASIPDVVTDVLKTENIPATVTFAKSAESVHIHVKDLNGNYVAKNLADPDADPTAIVIPLGSRLKIQESETTFEFILCDAGESISNATVYNLPKGVNGFSPTVNVEELEDITRITFTTIDGDTSVDIPKTVDVDLSNYYTKTEIDELIPTTVSQLVNDAEFVTQEYVDNQNYATESYVEDQISKIDIPQVDVSKFVTTDKLAEELILKANDVPFKTNYKVTKAVGGFNVGDSVQDLTIEQIFKTLLGLELDPGIEIPEGTPDSAVEIIVSSQPSKMLLADGTIGDNVYEYVQMTPEKSKENDTESKSFMYQVVDPSTGAAVETGYQIATEYHLNDYLTVAVPDGVEDISVKIYDPTASNWVVPNWTLVENNNYSVPGYTVYTVPAEYEILSGITVRVLINN